MKSMSIQESNNQVHSTIFRDGFVIRLHNRRISVIENEQGFDLVFRTLHGHLFSDEEKIVFTRSLDRFNRTLTEKHVRMSHQAFYAIVEIGGLFFHNKRNRER